MNPCCGEQMRWVLKNCGEGVYVAECLQCGERMLFAVQNNDVWKGATEEGVVAGCPICQEPISFVFEMEGQKGDPLAHHYVWAVSVD